MGEAYRGDDRRLVAGAPAAAAASSTRRRSALGALSGGTGAAALAALAVLPATEQRGPAAVGVAVVVGALPLLLAAALLLCAWRVGGRARPAQAAAALALAGGAGPVTAWLATAVAHPSSSPLVMGAALVAGVLVAAPHALAARRGPAVHTDLRPGLAVLTGTSLVVAAGAGAAALGGGAAVDLPVLVLPWVLLWPVALGAVGGASASVAAGVLRDALRAQQLRGLSAVAVLQRCAADLAAEVAEDRLRRHDARSALAAVRAASTVLTGEQAAVPADPALAAAVRSELSRVERLLAPAEGRSGVVDLREAVAPVVAAWRARGLDVTGPAAGEPALAAADADAVQRVVGNLLANAERHAPGARVEVAVAGAVLTVRDDGPGVPAAARSAVFSPGVRLVAGRAGEGLGLASARTLAEAGGGALTLRDDAPGACFELRLPPAPQPVAAR